MQDEIILFGGACQILREWNYTAHLTHSIQHYKIFRSDSNDCYSFILSIHFTNSTFRNPISFHPRDSNFLNTQHLSANPKDGPEPTGQRYCMNGAAMIFTRDADSPEMAEQASQMALADPYKLSPSQALPSVFINLLIGGLFFNAFLSSGKSTPIEYLTLLPAGYYGYLAARTISKLMA